MTELMRILLFLPEQASTFAERVDRLHFMVITTTMIVSFLIGTTAVVFYVLYRRRKPHEYTPRVEPDLKAEALFVGVPTVFFLAFFAVGFSDFVWVQTPPANALDVYVMGKQWMWKFSYPEGPNGVSTLHVPANRPVRLLITSRDVIHSFFVPAFRIKQDAVPGRYAEIWFEATKTGTFQVLCTEYCGLDHSMMRAEVVVHPPQEFDDWLTQERRGRTEQQDSEPVARELPRFPGNMRVLGERIATEAGCFKCHTVDGSPHIAPTFRDLYLKKEKLTDGSEILVDEAYITESMMDPNLRIVSGYAPGVMPTFLGRLDGPDSAAIVEYIKSLSTNLDPRSGPEGATR
jgi:cytochrome c oxidase subunit II